MITRHQIRAARALIGWKQYDLAKASGVSEASIRNIEQGATEGRVKTIAAIELAFRRAGVRFIEKGSMWMGGVGVMMES